MLLKEKLKQTLLSDHLIFLIVIEVHHFSTKQIPDQKRTVLFWLTL
jgi:hypothetical protein